MTVINANRSVALSQEVYKRSRKVYTWCIHVVLYTYYCTVLLVFVCTRYSYYWWSPSIVHHKTVKRQPMGKTPVVRERGVHTGLYCHSINKMWLLSLWCSHFYKMDLFGVEEEEERCTRCFTNSSLWFTHLFASIVGKQIEIEIEIEINRNSTVSSRRSSLYHHNDIAPCFFDRWQSMMASWSIGVSKRSS